MAVGINESLDYIINKKQIKTVFQPIISLAICGLAMVSLASLRIL